ncbi:hypothetical protein [Leptolyngbya sp. NM2-A1]
MADSSAKRCILDQFQWPPECRRAIPSDNINPIAYLLKSFA